MKSWRYLLGIVALVSVQGCTISLSTSSNTMSSSTITSTTPSSLTTLPTSSQITSSSITSSNPLSGPQPVDASDAFFRLFDPTITHQLVIEATSSSIAQLQTNMESQYEKYGHYRSSLYVPANFVYYENGIEVKRINDIGLRTHGNIFSRIPPNVNGNQMNPIHWRLSFDETFSMDPSSLEYEIRKKRDFFGLENLTLKWNRTGVGTSYSVDPYITESYGYSLYEKAGLMASKSALANVILTIDGASFNQGVMTMIEPVDDEFIEKRFLDEEENGNLYKALYQNAPANLSVTDSWMFGVKSEEDNFFPAYDIATNEDTNTGTDLKNFINGYKDLTSTTLYNYLFDKLDFDNYIRFMAMNYLFGNPDDIRYNSNNYYIYFSSGSSPKIYFIPTDLDKGLSVLDWNPDGTLMKDRLPYTGFSSGDDTTALIVKKTIKSGDLRYTTLYESYLNEFVSSFFTYDDFETHYNLAFNHYGGYTHSLSTYWGPKPMGLPSGIETYYCYQTYKVRNLSLPTSCD